MAQAIRPSSYGRPEAERRHITRSDLFDHPRRFRGRHHAATIFVVVLLAVVGFRLFPEQDVTVLNNGQALKVSATFDARTEGLAAADVSLAPGDRVISATGGRHASVAVQRAKSVSIQVDGQTVSVRTQAQTVGGAIAEAGLDLRPGDRVYLDGHLTTDRGPLNAVTASSHPTYAAAISNSQEAEIRVVRARPAHLVIDGITQDVTTAAPTVNDFLAELGMTVREGDLVRPSLNAPVTAGMSVRLAKGRTIVVTLDGKEQSLYTLAPNVQAVLDVLGVDRASVDSLSLPLDTAVSNGMSLAIGRTITREEEIEESVPQQTVTEDDPNLPAGQVRYVNGAPGKQVAKWSITYRNGEVVARERVSDPSITQVPVPNRQIYGTKAAPARPVLDTPEYTGTYRTKMNVRATWYTAAQGAWARNDPNYGRTATGVIVDHGICAVDPAVIPLHTRFWVPGYGVCVAADTGGLVKGATIDLGFPESAGDNPWATGWVEIYILD